MSGAAREATTVAAPAKNFPSLARWPTSPAVSAAARWRTVVWCVLAGAEGDDYAV
jgi:hypothetical protein